jgi:hypothetical protein
MNVMNSSIIWLEFIGFLMITNAFYSDCLIIEGNLSTDKVYDLL